MHADADGDLKRNLDDENHQHNGKKAFVGERGFYLLRESLHF